MGALIAMILQPVAMPACAQTVPANPGSGPSLGARQIISLARSIASTHGTPDVYARVIETAFEVPQGERAKMTAYEENHSFVYAVAEMSFGSPSAENHKPADKDWRWVRRLVVLNPSVFIVDDQLLGPIPSGMKVEGLSSQVAPKVSGREAHFTQASGELSSEILFPLRASYETSKDAESEGYRLQIASPEGSPATRFLQIVRVGKSRATGDAAGSELNTTREPWKLSVRADGLVYHLTLPPPDDEAGEISITASDGKALLAARPLPSGILPHGPEGDHLLELWDSDYRKPMPALWDIGRPADELQKLVSGGNIHQCRAVDMCCGSGTDAIYLASKGFDVTAIDVAPTALSLAQEKARKAGVSVHWILADILSPPSLKPFDFVYDRGCYHVVRDQNLEAYLKTVRNFSRPGTQFLLLAARRDEGAMQDSGVTEDELRFDFLNLFEVEWLRQIRLESTQPGLGPPGWSALMERKGARPAE